MGMKINLIRKAAKAASKVPKPRGLSVVVRKYGTPQGNTPYANLARMAGAKPGITVTASIRGKPYAPHHMGAKVAELRRHVGQAEFRKEGYKELVGSEVVVAYGWQRRGIARAMTIAAMKQTGSTRVAASKPWKRMLAEPNKFNGLSYSSKHAVAGFTKAMENMQIGPRGGAYIKLPGGGKKYITRKAFKNLPRSR
jgi:hypothetical protein